MHSQQLAQDIHVWRVDLDRPAAVVDGLAHCLSPDERQRAQRFVREADSRRFIVSHAALREVLGTHVGVSPANVEITVSSTGKPELAPRRFETALRFNLSHSDEIALVAVALDREVGVDVERVRPLSDMENIVRRYFAAGERSAWLALPDGERIAGFFRCWTRKEAYLKARGVGLSLGLDQFEVSLSADEPAGIVRDGDAGDAATQWCIYDVSPRDGYIAACVARLGTATVQALDWPLPPSIAKT